MSKSLFNPSEYDRLENCLISEPFVFPAVIDRVHNAAVLCDTGCNIMAAVHSRCERLRLVDALGLTPSDKIRALSWATPIGWFASGY